MTGKGLDTLSGSVTNDHEQLVYCRLSLQFKCIIRGVWYIEFTIIS